MTAVHAGTAPAVLPVPRTPADDAPSRRTQNASPRGGRAVAHQRVRHRVVRRELRLLADLLTWAPPAEPARTRVLTGHVELVSRLLLAHHRFEREALWPALADAVPERSAAALRAAVADWTVRAPASTPSTRTPPRRSASSSPCSTRTWTRPAGRASPRPPPAGCPTASGDSCSASRWRTPAPRTAPGCSTACRRQRWAWRVSGARRYRAAVVRLRGEPPAA